MRVSKIIDLSYTISSNMLVYPDTEQPSFQWIKRVSSEDVNLTRVTMLVHTGTHVDAPKHFFDNVPCIDEITLDSFFGTCKLFRYNKKPASQEITLEEVQRSGFDLNQGDIFLLATGIEAFAETREYNFIYPFPSEKLIHWLISKKIKAYMTDATSVDPVGMESSPKHRLLLGAGIPIVENLCNLGQLPEEKPFIVCALPLKLDGREGAPCRAVAIPDMETLDA
jgi:kynurenine formamidase